MQKYIQSGGEKYESFAKKKLQQLERLRNDLRLPTMVKHWQIDSATRVTVRSSEFGDYIRITGGSGLDFYETDSSAITSDVSYYKLFELGKPNPTTIAVPAELYPPNLVSVSSARPAGIHQTLARKQGIIRLAEYPLAADGTPDLDQTPTVVNRLLGLDGLKQFGTDDAGLSNTTYTRNLQSQSMTDTSNAAVFASTDPPGPAAVTYLATDGVTDVELTTAVFNPPWLRATATEHFVFEGSTAGNVRGISLTSGEMYEDGDGGATLFYELEPENTAANLTDVIAVMLESGSGNNIRVRIGSATPLDYTLYGTSVDGDTGVTTYDGDIIGVMAFDGGFAVATDGLGSLTGGATGLGADAMEDIVTIHTYTRQENGTYTHSSVEHMFHCRASSSKSAQLGVTKAGVAYVCARYSRYPDYPANAEPEEWVIALFCSDGTVTEVAGVDQADFANGLDQYTHTPMMFDTKCCFLHLPVGTVFGRVRGPKFIMSDGTMTGPTALSGGADYMTPVTHTNLIPHYAGSKDHAFVLMSQFGTSEVGHHLFGSDGTEIFLEDTRVVAGADVPYVTGGGAGSTVTAYGMIERSAEVHVLGHVTNTDVSSVFTLGSTSLSCKVYNATTTAPIVMIGADTRRIKQLTSWAAA